MSEAIEQPVTKRVKPELSREARFAEAWWQHHRGQRPTPPTAEEFDLSDSQAGAVQRQCEICQKYG